MKIRFSSGSTEANEGDIKWLRGDTIFQFEICKYVTPVVLRSLVR